MNKGKYICTQVISLILRQIFQRLVNKYKGEYGVWEFNCTNQLKYMLFALDSTTISCSIALMGWAQARQQSP